MSHFHRASGTLPRVTLPQVVLVPFIPSFIESESRFHNCIKGIRRRLTHIDSIPMLNSKSFPAVTLLVLLSVASGASAQARCDKPLTGFLFRVGLTSRQSGPKRDCGGLHWSVKSTHWMRDDPRAIRRLHQLDRRVHLFEQGDLQRGSAQWNLLHVLPVCFSCGF